MRMWEKLRTGNLLHTTEDFAWCLWGNVPLNVFHWISYIWWLWSGISYWNPLVLNALHLKFHNLTFLVHVNAKSRGLYKVCRVCLFHRTSTLPTSAAAGMMDWPSALSFTHTCLLIFPIKSSTVRTRQVHCWFCSMTMPYSHDVHSIWTVKTHFKK